MRLLCRALLAAAVTIAPLAVAAPAAAAEGLTVTTVEAAPWLLRRNSSTQWHVTVTNGGAGPASDVALTWSPLPSAVSMSVAPPTATIPAGETQSYTLNVSTGSAPFGDHPVTFTATSGDGTASGSGATTLRVGDVPGAPGTVSATRGDTTASLTWGTANPNGGTITSHVVTETRGGTTRTFGNVTSGVFTGLTNGVSYAFHVRAVNEFGPGMPTVPSNSVTPAGPPLRVTGVSAAAQPSAALVSWSPADPNGSPVLGYTVTRSPGGTTYGASGGATSLTVTGLANGTAYTFTVRASNSAGTGPDSEPSDAVTPADVPGAPPDVSATAGDTTATVTWGAAASNGSPVTGYRVRTADGTTTLAQTGAGTFAATVTGLTNGTSYAFSVVAVNDLGTSPASVTGTVVPSGLPFPPAGVAAQRGDGLAHVSWQAADGNGAAVTGYVVTAYPGAATRTVTGTSAVFDGLANGTQYTFTVRAVNGNGTGAESAPSDAVTPAGVPGRVTGVVATPGDTQVSLTWDAAPDNGSQVVAYRVSSPDTQEVVQVAGAQTTAVVPGLANGGSYRFWVQAVNAVGGGAVSELSAPVVPAGPPLAVTGVHTGPGDGAVWVGWSPADGNGRPVTGYVVTTQPGGATRDVAAGETGVLVTGLANGTAYTFTVRATNELGTGPASEPTAPVTPAGAPFAVTGVTVAAGDGSLAVGWTAANPNGSPLTSYTVHATGRAPVAVSPGATTASLTGLTNGTEYTVTVVATNAEGDSPPSAPVTATPFGRPFPPADVTAVARPAGALVSWVPGPANGRPVTGYTVTASPGGATTSAAAGATSVPFGGLTNGVAYSFTVRATNAAGDSAESAPSSQVTPIAPPGQVTGVTATPGELSVTVSWTPPADDGGGIEHYEVVSEPGSVELVPGSLTSVVLRDLDAATAYTFVVRAVNRAGTGPDSLPTAPVRPVAPDFEPPVVTVPALPAFTTAASVRLTYSATDRTGVAVYDVRYRAARFDAGFGAYQYPDTWQATEARSVTRTLAKGYTYCFSVRAWDTRDLASAWSAERCTAAPFDDRSLTASRGWTRGTSTAYYAGTFTATRTQGATLTRTGVRARRVALLATTCAGCGRVGVYRDGVLVKALSLAATRTRYRQLLVVDLGAVRTGTVTLRALGTDRVYVDGFAVSRV